MNNGTNTYHLELLRKINSLSIKHYRPDPSRLFYEHDKYLTDCNAVLFDYFKKSLSERFVFSALSYITHTRFKAKITIVKGDDEGTDYNFNQSLIQGFDKLRLELKTAIERVLSGELVSMTNILLDKNNTHDLYLVADECIYCRNIPGIQPNIVELPLHKINFYENKTTFCEDEQNKILVHDLFSKLEALSGYDDYMSHMLFDYIWHYKRISDVYFTYNSKPLYIHFIRPSIVDDKHGYNLLLSLATNGSLSETELAMIDLFIYRIVGQLFIERVKDEEHQNLLTLRSGMGHFLKNRVGQKKKDVEVIEDENTFNNEKINESCKKLKAAFDSLQNIGNFFYMISSITKNDGISVFGTKLARTKNWVEETRNSISITEILTPLSKHVYETTGFKPLKIIIDDPQGVLGKVEIQKYDEGQSKILPIKWIYEELFYELFYNAGKYSKSENSVFSITIEISENGDRLILTNRMKENADVDRNRFSGCLEHWGKIKNQNITELTGLAFVEEFLRVTHMGEIFARVSLAKSKFSIALKLKGLTKMI